MAIVYNLVMRFDIKLGSHTSELVHNYAVKNASDAATAYAT
jgi:hypothetical protein